MSSQRDGYYNRPTTGRTIWENSAENYIVKSMCIAECGDLGVYDLLPLRAFTAICEKCRSRRLEASTALKRAILAILARRGVIYQ